ncbi:hypothetical protein PPEP_b0607 [Pseudoalteromonas peptidolytica F12-50-A1]|uniref:Uncharacterized protein n=1 Tax=Pseudoalteromonas peptidolytica F12-50-A1 TaxID=1315280 RepID=A0A8I0N1E1_9GAMM|nr:hypothetical protein [Pseudoalteromonas peptidolytica F12-50-A1]
MPYITIINLLVTGVTLQPVNSVDKPSLVSKFKGINHLTES